MESHFEMCLELRLEPDWRLEIETISTSQYDELLNWRLRHHSAGIGSMEIWDPEHEMNLEGKLDWVEVMDLQSDSDGFYLGFETDYQGKLAGVFYPEPEMDLHLGGTKAPDIIGGT